MSGVRTPLQPDPERIEELLQTIKKISDLQKQGSIPHVGPVPDPVILEESLKRSDPGKRLEILQKSADDIRRILLSLGGASKETLRSRPPAPPPRITTAKFHEAEDDEEDIYENTGPGSRLARISILRAQQSSTLEGDLTVIGEDRISTLLL